MLGERRGFLFFGVLDLKRPGTRLRKFHGEGTRPSWWYWFRAGFSWKRLIDGELAASEEDLQWQSPSAQTQTKEADNYTAPGDRAKVHSLQ